ncbi:MAG: hypothetical protein NTX72_03335 [Candidatus Uhrbacteria bacterium]|nr:hypothetical protein [Candidatus Uhrbacteria bacterium]
MKRISKWIGLFGLIAVLGFGCVNTAKPTTEQKQVIDRSQILLDAKSQGLIMDSGEIEHMKDPSILIADDKKETAPIFSTYAAADFKTWHAAALADVTGGTSYGLAYLKLSTGTFQIAATLGDLPKTTDGSSYNVWLVKRGDGMKVLNLGQVTPADKLMTFTYSSKTDLSEYDFFVVTLQAPSTTTPGEHLLEGMIR